MINGKSIWYRQKIETGKYLRNALLGINLTESHEMINTTIRIKLGIISFPPFFKIFCIIYGETIHLNGL